MAYRKLSKRKTRMRSNRRKVKPNRRSKVRPNRQTQVQRKRPTIDTKKRNRRRTKRRKPMKGAKSLKDAKSLKGGSSQEEMKAIYDSEKKSIDAKIGELPWPNIHLEGGPTQRAESLKKILLLYAEQLDRLIRLDRYVRANVEDKVRAINNTIYVTIDTMARFASKLRSDNVRSYRAFVVEKPWVGMLLVHNTEDEGDINYSYRPPVITKLGLTADYPPARETEEIFASLVHSYETIDSLRNAEGVLENFAGDDDASLSTRLTLEIILTDLDSAAKVIQGKLDELHEEIKGLKRGAKKTATAKAKGIEEELKDLKGIIKLLRTTYVVPMQVLSPPPVVVEGVATEGVATEGVAIEDVKIEL